MLIELDENYDDLQAICLEVKRLIKQGEFEKCEDIVLKAMVNWPDAAQLQNLFGVIMEYEGSRSRAMKHFRAAWALDPSYAPARYNMDSCGTFFGNGKCAIDERDCVDDEDSGVMIEYDEYGIGHVVRRHK